MNDNNQVINQYLRRQLIRKWVIYIFAALLFVGLMSYALFKEHSPVTENNIITDQPKQNPGEDINYWSVQYSNGYKELCAEIEMFPAMKRHLELQL